jgi:uncharacterized protein (TIGR02271 family)
MVSEIGYARRRKPPLQGGKFMATKTTEVVDRDGLRGTIENPEKLDDPRTMSVPIKLESGSEVWVPMHLLKRQPNGVYAIDANLGNLNAPQATPTANDAIDRSSPPSAPAGQTTAEAKLPVIEEQVEIGKRKVDTAAVHIGKTVTERDELVDEPLFREEVKIDRVPINRPVDGPQQIRQEGDTTIVPLLEEVLVVEKRLMLKEELHITRVRWERHEQQRVPLRREEAHIEREDIRGTKEQTNG